MAIALRFVPQHHHSPQFVFHNPSVDIQLEPFFSDYDSTYYLFLPSCASQGKLSIMTEGVKLAVGEKIYNQGEPISQLNDGQQCLLHIDTKSAFGDYRFSIVKSEGVPMMDIQINENTLKRILQDQTYEGYAIMRLYSPEGQVLFDGKENPIRLKGRGNSTWWEPKKPFLLTFDQPDSLLGMSKGQKWVLLANAMDASHLRNKVVLDFASTLDMAWNPDSRYVELYLNGRYNGLYLITEKIELTDSRLNLAQHPQYLLLNDIKETIDKSNKPSFPSTGDQWVGLVGCVAEGDVQLDSLEANISRLKMMLNQGENVDEEALSKVLDLQSWANKYLTDELFLNGDVWRRSNFFYCTGTAPFKFYGGPVWDYDLAMSPGTEEIFAMAEELAPIRTMYGCPTFRHQVDSIYVHLGRPYLMWLRERGLDSLAQTIATAARADAIRWHQKVSSTSPYTEDMGGFLSQIDSLKSFCTRRTSTLDAFLLGEKPLQFMAYESLDPGLKGFFSTVIYRPDYRLADYLHQQPDSSLRTLLWIDSVTGQYYTVDSVPPPDCRLYSVYDANSDSGTTKVPTGGRAKLSKWLFPIIFTALFAMLFFLVGLREVKRWYNR